MAMKDLLQAIDPEQVRATMRAVAGQRKHGPRTCLICGAIVEGIATRRYCSNACRQRAKYRRRPVPPGPPRKRGRPPIRR